MVREGGVDCIIDVPMSALALGLVHLCNQKDKSPCSRDSHEDLTGKFSAPINVHWTYDSYALATTVARALLRKKLDRWFFIAADYAMGASVVRDASEAIREAGGTVPACGGTPSPGNGDFSSFLLQAQASGANVICFANAGEICQLGEAGKGIQYRSQGCGADCDADGRADRRAIGLAQCQGLYYSNAFYWD